MKKRKGILFLISLTIILILIIPGCKEKEPIKIGFVAALSGKFSGMGIEERNGLLLAIEDINASGGIKGRQLLPIYKDDENNAETAKKVVQELIDEEVDVIIGHMTSTMTLETYDLLKTSGILMISPSTSTNDLTGIKDHFFRVVETSVNEASFQAAYMRNELSLEKVSAVYDVSNKAYTKGWIESMAEIFGKFGGETVEILDYDASAGDTYTNLAEELLKDSPDAVVFAMGAIDSALLCQQLRKLSENIVLISSGWAKTDDFLNNGGAAVEGVYFSEMFSPNSNDRNFINFKNKFIERFGYEPNFAGTHAYESILVFKQILLQLEKDETYIESAERLGKVQGLQGTITFDEYGDVTRGRTMVVVKGGLFIRVDN